MTPRSIPAIKRIRQTRYIASDGQAFDSNIEAFRHETYLSLRQRIGELLFSCTDAEEITRGLLDTEYLRVVLLRPLTAKGPTANRPLGRRSENPGEASAQPAWPDTQATSQGEPGGEFP